MGPPLVELQEFQELFCSFSAGFSSHDDDDLMCYSIALSLLLTKLDKRYYILTQLFIAFSNMLVPLTSSLYLLKYRMGKVAMEAFLIVDF